MAKVGAIATILFAFSFLPQVVLFVGNMLVSDSALDYFTGHLDVLVEGAGRGRRSWRVYYAVIGVAIASLTDRRIVAGARRSSACSSSRRSRRASSSARLRARRRLGRRADQRAALPLYLRDLVFLGHVDRESPLSGVDNGGLLAIVVVRRACCSSASRVLLRRYRWVER